MLITRRALLSNGIKSGIGIAAWAKMAHVANGLPRVGRSSALETDQAARYTPAFKRLDEYIADRVTFDTIVDGQAMRMNYSGIEFFRAFTP
jgi:hypothetical protein